MTAFGTERGKAQREQGPHYRPAKKKANQPEVRQHVEAGSALYTDALKSYSVD